MVKKHNETAHKLFANLPLISFFVIILFLYAVYMATYLVKLVTNEYTYDKEQALPEGQYAALFLTMRTITFYTETMVSTLQSEEIALTSQEQKGTIYLIISHVFILLLLIAIFRTIFTSPGRVPVDWSNATETELYEAAEVERHILTENWKKRKLMAEQARTPGSGSPGKASNDDTPSGQGGQGEALPKSPDDFLDDPQAFEQLQQMAFLNVMKKENKRFCGHCQMFKPPRTHHCRQCNSCILKMDHHCPWVGNCVGFRNYKYFFNMVFYGVLLLWFMVATYTEVVSDTLWNMDVKVGMVFLIFFAYALNAVLALVITGFFVFHIWLVIRGKTTLEQVEDKESGNYNLGCWKNAKNTLGSNVLCWLIPTAPVLEENGLFSKSNTK